ncbi:MAG: TetR family transcriptional regulator [Acidobacteriota bacterium]
MSRKQSILEAAAKLFAEKGFDATATAEVARAAGVAEGTIFRHFKTKEEILVQIWTKMMELYIEEVRKEADEAPNGLEAVLRMADFHFRFVNKHAAQASVMFRGFPACFVKAESPHRKYIAESVSKVLQITRRSIERGIEDGSIREVSAEKMTFILRGLLMGLTRHKLLGLIDMPDISQEVVEFCRCALARNGKGVRL